MIIMNAIIFLIISTVILSSTNMSNITSVLDGVEARMNSPDKKIEDSLIITDAIHFNMTNMKKDETSNKNVTIQLFSELKEILQKNQDRNEETQILFTVAQVSGIFVAIIGGFFTTKVLSVSTERNRLIRQLQQKDSEIRTKDEKITHYQQIVDNILFKWAEDEIDSFKTELLHEDNLKIYNEDELIEKFFEYKNTTREMPDEYEIATLVEQCENIKMEISAKMQKRKTLFGDFDISSIMPSLLIKPNLQNLYNDAKERLEIETFEKNQIVSQKILIENDITDIALPESATRGIGVLFAALLLGIVVPLLLASRIEVIGTQAGAIGISLFLGCVIITLFYFGRELQKDLNKLIKRS